MPTTNTGYLPRVGHWEFDVTYNVDTWSDAIFDIMELPYDTRPDNTYALTFYPEPYHGMLKRAIAKAYQSGTPWDLELELVTAMDRRIWVRSHGSAVVENGVVLKVRGFLMDIDRYRAKETSFDLLKQQHKQLNTFTHVLTHNLRNHANNISLLTSLIDMDALDEDNTDLVGKIARVAENLNSTIDHLSDIIKINENVVESEPVDFDDSMDVVYSLLQAELEQTGADVQTDFTVPAIIFPKLYLESILTNLVTNSIKYKKEQECPVIVISTYKDDEKNCVILEYQDNGIGIDLKKHGDKIFGLYKTFTDRPGAHGVGLFLVKTQIESQGGFIIVESKPDVGTIFRIFFRPDNH
ncbi:MAG: ATP-binding protein [Bacteroidota bacterium]